MPQPMSVKDYADREGVTPDAIVRRIERGRLRGEKIDGRWYVIPDAVLEVPGLVPTDANAELPTVTLGEIVRGYQVQLAEKHEAIAQYREQIGELQEKLRHTLSDLKATEKALRRANLYVAELEARLADG